MALCNNTSLLYATTTSSENRRPNGPPAIFVKRYRPFSKNTIILLYRLADLRSP